MTEPEEGIVQVPVRKLWRYEASDFTPWLAENLGVLGDAIGLKLAPVRQEQAIGSFSLDILARETNEEVTVAIENQLEWTDHTHLGQLLTYAAGCDARIAIWVADEFQHEHAEALHRLNQWAGTNIRFYGVTVDVIQTTDDGSLEPKFHRVVYPYGWDKELTLSQPPPPNPDIQRYQAFYQPVIAKLLGPETKFADSYSRVIWHHDRFFPSAFDGDIGYKIEMGGAAWVGLFIRTRDSRDLSNRLFDELKKDQEDIESSIGAQGQLFWNKNPGYSYSTINMRKDGTLDDPPEKLEETQAWMFDLLPKFKGTFEERVKHLLGELRQQPE